MFRYIDLKYGHLLKALLMRLTGTDGKASLRGDGYPGTQSAMGLIIAAVGSPPAPKVLFIIADRSYHSCQEDRDKCYTV